VVGLTPRFLISTQPKAAGDDRVGFGTSDPAPPRNMLIGPHEQLRAAIDILEPGQIDTHQIERHSKSLRSLD
jgi:hypothetical protein